MLLCLLLDLANGAVTATSAGGWYLSLTRPPGTPPNWVFGPVWTVLYVLMALAAWLVWRRVGAGAALRLWGWQLAANALWSPVFFGARNPALGVVAILVLLALVAATARRFRRVRPLAGALMLPYLAWVSYAAYLNLGFWWLNRA